MKSMIMDLKIELTISRNLGLDIKYILFELEWLLESKFQVLLFFGKIYYVLHELHRLCFYRF